jgi:glycosyltransferase involved in cell wall biosynthesis
MISILIPIYNTTIDYIKECLDSIDSQTFKDYEVIVVNDGSNDEVTNFLNSLIQDKYSIYHQQKSGISKALNFGLSKCKYDLIARMDGDDIMLPDRLQKQFNFFQNNQVDVLGGQMELFGKNSSITNHLQDIPKDIMRITDWFMNHPTIMFRKELILKIGGYNSNFDGTEDLELWCRSLANGLVLKNLPDIIVRHRRHDDNATSRNNMNEILKKNFELRNYYLNIIYTK